ncbi:MAG: EamA family transporter, partial [bacterium]|nr:EamA family transporter [Candidatus Colisoma equi]
MQSRTKGILAITVSAFGFALMALFVRLCDDWGSPVNSFQKGFFRNLVALAIAGVAWWRAARRRTLDGRRKTQNVLSLRSKVLLVLRATLGTIGIFANFYALSHITIAEGQTLNKTAPFFTVLFAWLFLAEKATRRQILPLLLA